MLSWQLLPVRVDGPIVSGCLVLSMFRVDTDICRSIKRLDHTRSITNHLRRTSQGHLYCHRFAANTVAKSIAQRPARKHASLKLRFTAIACVRFVKQGELKPNLFMASAAQDGVARVSATPPPEAMDGSKIASALTFSPPNVLVMP